MPRATRVGPISTEGGEALLPCVDFGGLRGYNSAHLAGNNMNRRLSSFPTLRAFVIVGGLLATAFGFLCLTDIPARIILRYLSHDEVLNSETIAQIMLMGLFFTIFGWAAAAIGAFWPELIENAARMRRSELFFSASLIGTNLALFFGLALDIKEISACAAVLAVVIAGTLIFLVERRISRYVARIWAVVFNRWLAYVGYIAAGTFFFQLRFPFSTFNRFLFSHDFPMFQYTVHLDSNVLKQGWLYGWESAFSGGYPTFLNLRSLLIPYAPFAFLPPALGFHVMILTTYLAVPFLCHWLAKEISADRDVAVLSGWAGVALMTTYHWHILFWGMMPTFTSIPFLILAVGFFVRAMKGSKWGVFLSALFWAPVAYIHLGHFAHAGIVLFILAFLYTWRERSAGAAKTLGKVTVITLLFASPYLIEFLRFHSHVLLTNYFSYPPEDLLGVVRKLLTNVSLFVPTLMWHWSRAFQAAALPDTGYFAFFTIFSLAVAYLVFSGNGAYRRTGLLYAGVILVSALSFVPKFQLSFQRMLYMVPPIMALALGCWCAEAKKRGLLTPFYVLILLLIFYTRPFFGHDKAIPTLEKRGDFDPSVVEEVKHLDGNYILFENTASLCPYVDRLHEFQGVEEKWDVHAPGFLRLATRKRFFAHPGYNPHPYYDLRDTYIATGTYMGHDLADYEPDMFKRLFVKWGIEYLVLWSRPAKAYFGQDPDYEKVLDGARYTIYRFRRADPRAVVTEGGGGYVRYPGNFTAEVTLKGVPDGSRVIIRTNYFPQWRATCDGREVTLFNQNGQTAFDAPQSNCAVQMHFPKHTGYFLIPLVAFLVGAALSLTGKL